MLPDIDPTTLAREAYGDAAEWNNIEGRPTPPWDEAGEDCRAHWVATARKTLAMRTDYGPQCWHAQPE